MNKCFLILLLVLIGCGEDSKPTVKTYQNDNPLIASKKWSTLHEFVNTNNVEGIKALMNKKVDVNIVAASEELRQMTPLQLAVKKGSYEIAELLLDSGAMVNQVTTTGMTALHFAIDLRHAGLIQLLVKSGADLKAESLFVHPPAKYAREKGYEELLPLLDNVSN